MIILGIDPSSKCTGWGVIRVIKNKITAIEHGHIDLPAKRPMSEKLDKIYNDIADIMYDFPPEIIAIERGFYGRNAKTAWVLGMVSGAIHLVAVNPANAYASVYEYAPKEIKLAVAGNGNATKERVRETVKKQLGITTELTLDESDALAIALCCARKLSEETK